MNTTADTIKEFIILQEDNILIEEMIPISIIKDLFESEGYELEDLTGDGNTNGWSVDFWYYFEHPEKARYCLSGSLWYGNFKICKNADQL